MVPTDFSDQAENALRVAAQLAKKGNGEIYLLHMLELPLDLVDPASQDTGSSIPESIYFMKLAHQRFQEIMKSDFLEGITVHETVKFHQAFEGIMEISRENDCDMIIMGSKGVSGVKEIFIGSNTEKVIRHSDIPVLVIKDNIPVFEVDNFILASDFKEDGKGSFVEAMSFARKIGARVHLLYVNTPNRFKSSQIIDERMKAYADISSYKNFSMNIYNDDSIEKGILNFGKKMDAGLIGVCTHARKGLSHLLRGSISEDVVNHAEKPVITFKI
jgi:nucleotide-binding universal stress UspA family protein